VTDYDLVILGGTTEARYAAKSAALLNARVALVEPEDTDIKLKTQLNQHILRQASKVIRQFQIEPFHLLPQRIDGAVSDAAFVDSAPRWVPHLPRYSQLLHAAVHGIHAPNQLATLGVDVIQGNPEFKTGSPIAIQVNQRQITACACLIATGSQPRIPILEGLSADLYLTPDALPNPFNPAELKRVTILGRGPIALEWAQTLVRLGTSVILLSDGKAILPREDAAAARLIQAQLQVEGVKILPHKIHRLQRDGRSVRVELQDHPAIETDRILIALGSQPHVASINLAHVGVQCSHLQVRVNRKLQTTNPRIYACGSAIGGYRLEDPACYEGDVVLREALFSPGFIGSPRFIGKTVDYRGIPYAIHTAPELARVGLTADQARERYGTQVCVLKQSFSAQEKAQLLGDPSGFCKLVLHANGTLLGAHIVGIDASETIHLLALAIQQGLNMSVLAEFPWMSVTLTNVITQLAEQWNQWKWQHRSLWHNQLENWFNFHRTWG